MLLNSSWMPQPRGSSEPKACYRFIKKGKQQVCTGVQDFTSPDLRLSFDVISSTEKN